MKTTARVYICLRSRTFSSTNIIKLKQYLYPCLNQLVIFALNGLLLGLPCDLACVICTPISGLGIGLLAGLLNALLAGLSTSIISASPSTSSSSHILPATLATEAAR